MMHTVLRFALPVVAVVAVPLAVEAQEFDLSVRNVMRGYDLVGNSPEGLRGERAPSRGGARVSWSPDSRYFYFRWEQAGVDTNAVVYRANTDGDVERLADADPDTIVAGRGVWDRRGRRALYSIDGNLVLWDGGTRQLTRTESNETGPIWTHDERGVIYRSGSNLFRLEFDSPMMAQLTDIRSGNPPDDEEEAEGQRAFLEDQQERLFDFIRRNRDENYPWAQSPRDTSGPEPFYIGENRSLWRLNATPDGAWAAATVFERAQGDRRVEMPVWVTEDGYVDVQTVRNKVGDRQGSLTSYVINLTTGEAIQVGDSITEAEHDVRVVDVAPHSRHVLLRVDTKDDEHRWYAVVDLPSLETRVVEHHQDSAWIGGPASGTAGFMPDGDNVYFVSERTGWAHLYLTPSAGGAPTQLTSGEWEVHAAQLSRDGATWYITGNRDGFAEMHFYMLPAEGGDLTRITLAAGRQDATPSPDGRWLALAHSEADLPWDLYVQRNRTGQEMRRLTKSTTDEFDSFDWIKPQIVMIEARDGVMVPARIYRPTDSRFSAGEEPAVIFVHGAGYLQNVHNWWSIYFREYMFHHVLAANGYTVLDLDYRGSAGHGRDWRTAIYRHMGGLDLTDQVDGAAWLVAHEGVHPERIGIYGGSYGGFITLMAMFTEPGVFEAGAALRPVTDWAHYNHPYTSNILNEPQNDSLSYERSSPIYFAEGLEGHLLMAHGMIDDNVHFHDTVRLAQRLIELGKENWEVAMYPIERHSFTEISSWQDEYRRIFELFERTLK